MTIMTRSNSVRFLLASGQPRGEPIARHGPFVRNTEQETEQALLDSGKGRSSRREIE